MKAAKPASNSSREGKRERERVSEGKKNLREKGKEERERETHEVREVAGGFDSIRSHVVRSFLLSSEKKSVKRRRIHDIDLG